MTVDRLRVKTPRLSATLVFLGLTAISLPAFAERKQEAINQYTVKAEEFSARDTGKIVTAEIGWLKAFLDEARTALTQEEDDDLAMALDRVKAAAELIEAELARADIEDQANKAQGRAETKESELAKLNDDIKSLEKERAALEAGGAK